MDKYEFNIKVEQIKKLISKSDYGTAMKIADTIDWRRVRNTNLLSMVATVYEKNEEYQEAKDILLLAFERAPIGKRLLYKLTELALKEGNIKEAEAYYREFSDLASDDPRQNLLRYMILKEKGASMDQLIHSLESYITLELDEKWMYELAELYSRAGMKDDCVKMCDKIMLMFGLGQYVDQAMELKMQFAPLTQYQMDLVENRDKYEARLRAVEKEFNGPYRHPRTTQEEEIQEGRPDVPQESVVVDLQAKMQEAEVEEKLAREMSKISIEDYPEDSQMEKTRTFTDLKNLRTNTDCVVRAMPGMAAAGAGMAAGITGTAGTRTADLASRLAGGSGMAAATAQTPTSQVIQSLVTPDRYGEPSDERALAAKEATITSEPAYDSYQRPDRTEYGCERGVPRTENYQDSGYESDGYEDQEYPQVEYYDSDYEEEEPEYPASEYEGYQSQDLEYEAPEYGGQETEGKYRCPVYDEPEEEEPVYPDDQSLSEYEDNRGGENDYIGGENGESGYDSLGYEEHQEEPAYQDSDYEEERRQEEMREQDYMAGAGDERRTTPYREDDYQESSYETYDDSTSMEAVPPGQYVMIEEASSSRGLELAIETLKYIHRELGTKHKVAKITGEKLNNKGIFAVSHMIAGKDLIVEQAGALSDIVLEELDELLSQDQTGINVILIDSPRRIEIICRYNPSLAEKFQRVGPAEEEPGEPLSEEPAFVPPEEPVNPTSPRSSVDVAPEEEYDDYEEAPREEIRQAPVERQRPQERKIYKPESAPEPARSPSPDEMTVEEFAEYACQYASDIDCSINGKSMLALYERIEIMEEDGIPLSRENAEQLIEEAADKAEKPSFGKLLKGIVSPKYDKDGLLILKEEHFIK